MSCFAFMAVGRKAILIIPGIFTEMIRTRSEQVADTGRTQLSPGKHCVMAALLHELSKSLKQSMKHFKKMDECCCYVVMQLYNLMLNRI